MKEVLQDICKVLQISILPHFISFCLMLTKVLNMKKEKMSLLFSEKFFSEFILDL